MPAAYARSGDWNFLAAWGILAPVAKCVIGSGHEQESASWLTNVQSAAAAHLVPEGSCFWGVLRTSDFKVQRSNPTTPEGHMETAPCNGPPVHHNL